MQQPIKIDDGIKFGFVMPSVHFQGPNLEFVIPSVIVGMTLVPNYIGAVTETAPFFLKTDTFGTIRF